MFGTTFLAALVSVLAVVHFAKEGAAAEKLATAEPVQPSERIYELDVLRGFALIGVLLAYTLNNLGAPPAAEFGLFDKIVGTVLPLLIDQKFYTLFAFLFGLGFAIQLSRADARGYSVVPLYCRRLAVLLVIGLLHAVLLRNGDILAPYAIIGFLLILFRNASNRTLLIAGFLSIAFPIIAGPLLRDVLGVQFVPRPGASESTGATNYVVNNFEWVKHWYSRGILTWPPYLSLFLVGLYVGRSNFFEKIGQRRRLLWKLAGASLIIAVIALTAVILGAAAVPREGLPQFLQLFVTPLVFTLIFTAHTWSLAAFYALCLFLLMQKGVWRHRLFPLASIGRMALTNYLLQAGIVVPICLVFGLFDQVTPTLGLVLALLVLLIEVPFSVVWLRYFNYGPAEWFWRSLTYGKVANMSKIA